MTGPAAPWAVLFDFDGLLADSEPLHSRLWREVLEEHGVRVTEEQYRAHWIRAGRSVDELLAERGLDLDPAALRAAKFARYVPAVERELRPMRGALELVASLRGRAALGLATSGWSLTASAGLRRLGLTTAFGSIVTFERVARPKPHPDAFLLAAEELGVPPARCVVLEDAEKGVRAAHAAGMRVVAVPTEDTADNDFALATRVVASLSELSADALRQLVERDLPPAEGGRPVAEQRQPTDLAPKARPPAADADAEGT